MGQGKCVHRAFPCLLKNQMQCKCDCGELGLLKGFRQNVYVLMRVSVDEPFSDPELFTYIHT